MIKHGIKPGLSTTYTKEALMSNTIYPSGTSGGILDYLVSTALVIEQVMELSSKMLDSLLPDDYITVGKKIELTHENATLIGETIVYLLMVTKVEEESVFLDITISDSVGVICRGKYERAIVNKEELLNNAFKRSAKSV